MKKLYTLFFITLISAYSFGQTIIYQENFETNTNGINYNTSVSEFTDFVPPSTAGGDFFIRTDETNIASYYNITGQEGSYYFGAMDLDGEGATLPLTLSTIVIDVTDLTNIDFSILLAEDDDINQDWDNADYVHITYSIDGGASQNLIWVEGDETSGTASNSTPRIDTNFNGTGDGDEITSVFTEYIRNISLSDNNNIQFFIEYNLNSGDEDLSIDNIRVTDPTVLSTKGKQIEDFNMNPNPTSLGYINISSKSNAKMNVFVFDVLGKQVLNKTVIDKRVDLSSLKTGVYIMKVIQDKAVETKKLVIK